MNRSVQCGRLRLDGVRCRRRATVHGYCQICWNLHTCPRDSQPSAPRKTWVAVDDWMNRRRRGGAGL